MIGINTVAYYERNSVNVRSTNYVELAEETHLYFHTCLCKVVKITFGRNLSLLNAAHTTSFPRNIHYDVSKIWDVPLETSVSKLKVG